MQKKYLVLAVLLVVAIVFVFTGNDSAKKGKVVFAVTDVTADIKDVSSINVTVNQISVHSALKGWVTVSSATKEFDLLKLKNSNTLELAAEANLETDTYDQIRLNISKVVVVKGGQSMEAKIPSNTLTLKGKLVVNENTTSTIVFDFLADKSLHITGSGKFILAPVVRVETKSGATVSFEGKKVKIAGGKIEHENTQSMDEKGEVEVGVIFNEKDELDEVDGVIKVKIFGKDDKDDDDSDNDDGNDDGDREVKLNFSSQNNSGIAGTAKLEEGDGKVEVKLNLLGVTTGVSGLIGIPLGTAHPAHIHLGSCANIGAVKYPLASTVNGESKTEINASFADLKAQLPLAINVHKSAEEMGVYVACTDIKL